MSFQAEFEDFTTFEYKLAKDTHIFNSATHGYGLISDLQRLAYFMLAFSIFLTAATTKRRPTLSLILLRRTQEVLRSFSKQAPPLGLIIPLDSAQQAIRQGFLERLGSFLAPRFRRHKQEVAFLSETLMTQCRFGDNQGLERKKNPNVLSNGFVPEVRH